MLAEGVMRLHILFFLNFFLFSSISLSSEKKILLGLDWFINPDHAPIILAAKYGYFNDEDLKVKRQKIQNEIDSEIINADNEIKKFKIESQNKIASIAENIVSDLLKYIFSEEGNKSSIKGLVRQGAFMMMTIIIMNKTILTIIMMARIIVTDFESHSPEGDFHFQVTSGICCLDFDHLWH